MSSESNPMDMGWDTSTHRTKWLFPSSDIISQRRQKTFQNGLSLLHKYATENNKKWNPPTTSEYQSLLRSLEKQITRICDEFRLPPFVAASAVLYFKRFYLNYSLLIDGNSLAITALFLATKTEQSLVDIEIIAKHTNVELKRITKNEIILLDGIQFSLKIWHPFRPLRRLIGDFGIQFKKQTKKKLPQCIESLIETQSTEIIKELLSTDIPLIYPPSQIALGAFLLSCSNLRFESLSKNSDFLKSHLSTIDVNELKKSFADRSRQYFENQFCRDKIRGTKLKNVTQLIQNAAIESFQQNSNKAAFTDLVKLANRKMQRLQMYFGQLSSDDRKKIMSFGGGGVASNDSIDKSVTPPDDVMEGQSAAVDSAAASANGAITSVRTNRGTKRKLDDIYESDGTKT